MHFPGEGEVPPEPQVHACGLAGAQAILKIFSTANFTVFRQNGSRQCVGDVRKQQQQRLSYGHSNSSTMSGSAQTGTHSRADSELHCKQDRKFRKHTKPAVKTENPADIAD
ncbi:MAG: hypothetical protein RLZZ232_815 [Planctomycetota bacterium]|jgi:hypothetical protein